MRILFVCTGNTCRSPMAERLGRLLYPEKHWESAGVMPSGVMHWRSAEVLNEHGADPEGFTGRSVFELDLGMYDYVILIGEAARTAVTDVPVGTQVHYWDVADPFEAVGESKEIAKAYRACAEELIQRINGLTAGFDTDNR